MSFNLFARPRRALPAAAAAAFLAIAGPAWSGDDPRPVAPSAPAVEELVRTALVNAPSLAARKERIAAAQASAGAAGVLPDPTIEFEFRDGGFPRLTIGSDPMSMLGATVRQPLLTGGRRAASLAFAAAEIDLRHVEADQTACDLTMAVRMAYGSLYALDQERAIVRDAAEMAHLLAETATARYAAGGVDQVAVLRAQLEVTRLAERAADLGAERTKAVATMNRLLNLPPDAPFGEVRELTPVPGLPASLAGVPDTAASRAPEVSVRKAEVEAAGRRVDAARAELKPSFTVGGSFYWQGGVDRVVALSVGVDWPLRKDRRQQALVLASERERDAARRELEDTAAETRAEAARLVAEIHRAEDQITRYRSGLLPQSSAALDAARASYLAGRGDFPSVLDEFRRWTDLRVELARREASRFTAMGQLDVLINPAEHGPWEHEKEPRS